MLPCKLKGLFLSKMRYVQEHLHMTGHRSRLMAFIDAAALSFPDVS